MIQGTVTGLEEDELADEQREINLTESLNCGLKGSACGFIIQRPQPQMERLARRIGSRFVPTATSSVLCSHSQATSAASDCE